MGEKMIRVLICEDHELVRTGFVELIKDSVIIAGEAEEGNQLVEKYFSLRPDVVLTDLDIPFLSGIQASRKILEQDPKAKILILTMHYTEVFIVSAYKLGIGILSKDVSKTELLYAIKTVSEGKVYFGPNYPEDKVVELSKKYKLTSDYLTRPNEVITEREDQVLKLVSKGLMSAEIAEELHLSKKAIDAHRYKIMQKFQLKSFAALMKFAIEYTNSKKNSINTIVHD